MGYTIVRGIGHSTENSADIRRDEACCCSDPKLYSAGWVWLSILKYARHWGRSSYED